MPDVPLLVTFRREIIQKLLRTLRQGESCSLVGVGSSGKSNIVRHINRADVREYYLGAYAQYVLNLYVNCAKLTKTTYTARSLHCLILEATMKAARTAQSDVAAIYSELRTLWKEAIESESDALARSNLEDAFRAIFQAGIKQVFIALDDFDTFFAEAPAPAVNSLRALRDDYKSKIMYLTVTRRELEYLRDPDDVEDFLELVVPATTFAAEPYSETDAKHMIERLTARETPPRSLSNLEQDWLMDITGRHPGLIRIVCKVTQDQVKLMSSDLLDQLREHPAVVEECEKIWASLEKSERDDVEAVVSENQPAGQGVRALLGKGIIRAGPDHVYDVLSPLFANFVVDGLKQQLPIQVLSVHQVRIDKHIVDGLSIVESQLISRLIHEYPKPASKRQLLRDMLAAEAGQPQTSGPPERRRETYFNEIKRKIGSDYQDIVVQLPDGRYRISRTGGQTLGQ